MNTRSRLRGVFILQLALAIGLVVLHTGPSAPPVAAAQDKSPNVWTLLLVMTSQEADNWCWASSAQMTMSASKVYVTQGAILNALDNRTDCAQRPVPDECNHGGSSEPVLTKYGFTFDSTNKPLSQDDLVRQLFTLQKPVIFAWDWTGGGGHVMVVKGYARVNGQFYVEVADPWPPALSDENNLKGGSHTFITYDRWVADTDHTFQGATYNITKK